MLKKVIIYALLLISITLGGSQYAIASDMNFFTEAVIPANQMDKTLTYFDLKMKPQQVQELHIRLKNTAEKATTIHIEPYTATTNQNGVIDYQTDLKTNDRSLKYAIKDLLIGENVYYLEAGEEIEAVFKLSMPKEPLEGILLGGFKVYQEEKETKEQQEKETTQIKNVFTRVIGIKLTETETTIKPELQLNEIKPGLQNYRTVVTANIQNTMPTIVSGLSVEAKIRKKDTTAVIKEEKKVDMSMAPNSNFDFPINWENQELISGKYILNLVAKDQLGNDWTFEKEFEIKSDEARKYNNEAVELDKTSQINWFILASLAILSIITLLIYRLIKKRARKKQRQKQQKKRQQKQQQKQRQKRKKKRTNSVQ